MRFQLIRFNPIGRASKAAAEAIEPLMTDESFQLIRFNPIGRGAKYEVQCWIGKPRFQLIRFNPIGRAAELAQVDEDDVVVSN